MKTESVEVKLKGKVVDVVDVPIYETVDELAGDIKEEEILQLINRQLRTDLCNKKRGEHRESAPGKTKRYNMAFNVFPSVTFSDGSTGLQKLTEIAQLPEESKRKEALDALLASPEVQAVVDERLGVIA